MAPALIIIHLDYCYTFHMELLEVPSETEVGSDCKVTFIDQHSQVGTDFVQLTRARH